MLKNAITVLSIIFLPAIAQAGAIDLLDANLRAAVSSATSGLETTAILWLSSFVLIQAVITNLGLLKSGAEIEAVFGKLMGSLLWFGFCFYVLKNGVGFITSISGGIFDFAGTISGAGAFDAASIIGNGAEIAGGLLAKINDATGITDMFLPSIIGGLLGCVILATAALIAFKVFLIKIETMLIIMMAPLSFSFLGLNALKDQGIAPFKSLISLIYRILLIAIILKTMGGMSENLTEVINTINGDSIDGIWSVVFSATLGYVLLGFLVFKSDSIAASLASGSTNLGTGDVASAAAMGAAAGAAIGSGGMATGSAAAKVPQSMSGFISSLSGGAGSLSNASSQGAGGVGSGALSPSSASLASPSSANGQASAPQFETNKAGAPIKPAAAIASPVASGAEPQRSNALTNPEAAALVSGDASSGNAATSATPSSMQDSAVSSGVEADNLGESSASPDAGPASVGNSSSAAAPVFQTNKAGAPVRPDASQMGSAASVAVQGSGVATDQKLDRLMEQMAKQSAPRATSFKENVASMNQHMAQEKASTGVSINANAGD